MTRGSKIDTQPDKLLRRLQEGPALLQDLFDVLYGDDPNGGPGDGDNAVFKALWRLRTRGHVIDTVYSLRSRRK